MISDFSITEILYKLRHGEFSIKELIEESYVSIEKYDSKVNACITVIDKSFALQEAEIAQKNLTSLPLAGIPFVLKDAYITRGIRTTAASKVLDNFIAPYDATVYAMLKKCGAILLGKMNMDAWGHGGSTENTDYGVTRNPWDMTRSAGGSGGGPAAAIALRYCPFAIGEDTGGSIRNPAAWNNITALKVTYGRVSRYGAIAYASSLDTVGPTAKTVQDCSIILEYIAGFDKFDATSSHREIPHYSSLLANSVRGKKIAIPEEYFSTGLDPEYKKIILQSLEVWKSLGVIIEHISMPMLEYGVPMYYIIVSSETSSNLARFDGVRYGNGRKYFTKESMRRIMLGTYTLSAGYVDAFYKNAQRARTLLRDSYTKTLETYDAILAPVNPIPPPKFGELLDDPVKNMYADLYTGFINLIGVPSLALPCGFTGSGLPVGMQLIGKMFSEGSLLNLGHQYQSTTDWHTKKPNVTV